MALLSIQPYNYRKVDDTLSRSAQPDERNIVWLKSQGVTDIVNLRTMYDPQINFDEKELVELNGMIYHNIPSHTRCPKPENVGEFLDIVEGVKQSGGKVHVHCKQGADRTGMYTYIYERVNKVKPKKEAKKEFVECGWHSDLYPDLDKIAEKFVKMFKK